MRAISCFLFLFLATFGHALYKPLHPSVFPSIAHRLQSSSTKCQEWIFSAQGIEWLQCFLTFTTDISFSAPNASNNCQIDLTPLCTDPCYQTMANGFDYLAKSGVCDPSTISNDLGGGCSANPSLCYNATELCYNDQCLPKCSSVADCYGNTSDPCSVPETNINCVQPTGAQEKVCMSNVTTNLKPSMAAISYSFMMICAKAANGDYCANVLAQNALNNVTTCDAYGCCLGTFLQAGQYCLGIQDFGQLAQDAGQSLPNLTLCQNAQDTCPPLPLAKTYCALNGVEKLGLSLFVIVALIFASLWTTL